jgi:hypothetical protein
MHAIAAYGPVDNLSLIRQNVLTAGDHWTFFRVSWAFSESGGPESRVEGF